MFDDSIFSLPKFDLDFDFDFGEMEVNNNLVYGAMLKRQSGKRIYFNPKREVKQVKALVPSLPKPDEVFKIMSIQGGFSSLAILMRVAMEEPIEKLYVTSFAIGKNRFKVLMDLREKGLIGDAWFLTNRAWSAFDRDKGVYDYHEFISNNLGNWKMKTIKNHSKVLLMKTANNYYVCETSGNLNENPQIEQFSFENGKDLFDFHLRLFKVFFEGIE